MAGIGHVPAQSINNVGNEVKDQSEADKEYFIENADVFESLLLEIRLLNIRVERAFDTGLNYEDLDDEYNSRHN